MKYTKNIESLIKKFCAIRQAQVKTTPQLDEKILADALPAQNKSKTEQSTAVQSDIWSIIMRNRMTKYAVVAVIIFAMIIGFVEIGKPVGVSVAFAAAMDKVREAGTFSCIEIFEASYGDAEEHGKYLLKQKSMFKEPDWERHESLTSPWPKYIGETTITDYGTRQKLILRPVEKTARLYNLVSEYTIDDKTGELKLTQLDTRLRDRLLEWSQGAVDDHGEIELEGKPVRVLQSRQGGRVTTVWIDPETNYPVQIEHKWTDQNRSPVMYTSIQIDTELDDDLFSLEPPVDYSFTIDKSAWPNSKEKMAAKIMHLGKCCLVYANKHNDMLPADLADLVASGIITEGALKKVCSALDDPEGIPVIQYRQPDTGVEDFSNEVMLYENYEDRSADDLVVVTMLDSHAELIPVRVLEQYLKPWSADRKKVSACMAYLYGFCGQYAKEHDGWYPEDLANLISGDVSDKTIKRLQSAWGKRGGSQIIQYRLPRADVDPAAELMFYEICDKWPEGGAVVCFADGHCEIISDQNRFEELIR